PGSPAEGLLEELWNLAKTEGLKYVYLGNVPGHRYENTYCPSCGKLVIGRIGFQVTSLRLKGSSCAYCGSRINVRI
ncbi:MAG: hypothetical protein NQU41_01675, partial [Candidatus Methanosuratincola sp.]|nr:hypothetical protein [Candidatus Methanosuratincola sp.]